MTNEEIRKQKNKDLVERYKKGESIQLIPSSATWFPQRPIIKKDEKIVKELYGDNATVVGEEKKTKLNLVKSEEGEESQQ
jgi:hypothetical protein